MESSNDFLIEDNMCLEKNYPEKEFNKDKLA